MDLSPSESFNLLYYALSLEDGGRETERCSANMVDTLLFHNGMPYRWLFTSEKSGLIMKKSGNQWNIDDIKHAFKKRFTTLRGKRTGEHRSKFAIIWYVDAPQKITYRVVDEEEFDYLLQNRFFTQYIAAVQLYFGGYPLKGSGWFEHRVWTDVNDRELHQTSELIMPPEQPESLDLNKFISNVNNVIQMGPDAAGSYGVEQGPKKLYITESQHDYLKPVASKLLSYLRTYSHCKVVDATFMFGFNSTWAPFVIGIRNVQLREVPQSVSLMRAKMFSSFDSMFTRDMQVPSTVQAAAKVKPSSPAVKPNSPKHDHRAPHLKKISRYDSMDVIPSFNFGQTQEFVPEVEFTGDPTDPENIPKPNLALLKGSGSGNLGGNVDYSKRVEVPVSVAGTKLTSSLPSGAAVLASTAPASMGGAGGGTSSPITSCPSSPKAAKVDPRAVGGGGNISFNQTAPGNATDSILNDYALAYGIGFRTYQISNEKEREERHKVTRQNILNDFQTEKSRRTLSSTAVSSKSHSKYCERDSESKNRYSQITDAWSRRVKAYPSQVRGSQDESWEEFRRTLRPLSAPPSPGQTMLARTMSGPIPAGFHGKLPNARKATGVEKRNTMTRGTHCHGDFCALAPQLVKATQDRQRQNQREEEERRSLEAKQAEEARRKTEEAAAANKGGKGYINFSMLAAVAMKEKAKETSSASQLNETAADTTRYEPSPSPFDRKERAKQALRTLATHDIPCKSIMMSRVEEKFTGFNYLDLVHQYTQMGFALEDILSECARMSLTAVADKCRAEAFRSACTQKHTPDMNSLNGLEAAHRKLVYSEALSTVHPSKFYQTVPVCETCFQLYSCLDSLREVIVFLRTDSYTNSYPTAARRNSVLAAGVTESASHVKSVFSNTNSSGDNEYYKNLQKSLSKYSRDGSDAANSAEQQALNSRLAEPRYKSEKFSRPQSATAHSGAGSSVRSHSPVASSPSSSDIDAVPSTHLPFGNKKRQHRPRTAGTRRKDHFIEGQLSDRRTSKLPFQNKRTDLGRTQKTPTTSKFVAQKRSLPLTSQLETVEDVSVQETECEANNGSYFAGDAEDELEMEKSSYLLLANSVPRVHSQSGPTLGTHPVSFQGQVPARGNHDLADPDKSIQLKNFSNIKRAENSDAAASNGRVVTDQHGTELTYSNVHFVHSL